MILLCGDIGASNSRLALVEVHQEKLSFVAKEFLKNAAFESFHDALTQFQKNFQVKIDAASFGVAGPVLQGEVEITNLNWQLSETSIAEHLKIKRCFLINDLEAIAFGISAVGPRDFEVIQPGHKRDGVRAVIAPGSGIGEAILYWDGYQHKPMPTEGGHSSFSPTSPLQLELLQYLFTKWSHVSWERVLSGPGIINIYEFLRSTRSGLDEPQRSTSAQISEGALHGDELCVATIDLFFEILATEAANLALKSLPHGGLYIAGGITPKLLKLLNKEKFAKHFSHKGRMSSLLEKFEVILILNEDVGILGAARHAQFKVQALSKRASL